MSMLTERRQVEPATVVQLLKLSHGMLATEEGCWGRPHGRTHALAHRIATCTT
jgi:hypothetical protein